MILSVINKGYFFFWFIRQNPLKELQDRILCFVSAWSLQIYIGLNFLPIFLKNKLSVLFLNLM